MADLDELSERFRNFARTTTRRAPLYSQLSAGIADDPEVTALLAAAPTGQQAPVLLFAAVHALLLADSVDDGVRGDDGAALAAFYSNLAEQPAEGDAYPHFRRYALGRADDVKAIVATTSTQTNEVGRCAQFVPALSLLEAEVGPMAMIDVGTSAGLNLLLPHYSYEYTPGGTVGEPSTVHLECQNRGGVPVPATMPAVVAGVGIDRSPIDVFDDAAVRWLEACVWPDQADRFQRLVAAVALAREHPADVRRGDATHDLPGVVREMAGHGHPVVVNSWVLSYFSASERLDYVAMLDALGAELDLSWLIAESPAQTPELPVPTTAPEAEHVTVLTLVRWRHGARSVQRLATTHPHGFWLQWEPNVTANVTADASDAASPPPC